MIPGQETLNRPSTIYHWDGSQFVFFQEVDSAWGYNWHAFDVGGQYFLAYADHLVPSSLLHWNGERFVPHQVLVESAGRAFASFSVDGEHYLAVACLTAPSWLFRWDGDCFVNHQQLDGIAGREFAVVRHDDGLFLIRVNFIAGTQQEPEPSLNSQVYQWRSGKLMVVEEFATTGGTDVTTWEHDKQVWVAISNGLNADAGFRAQVKIYRFTVGER